MLILGVTTSTDRCGAALWRGGEVLGEEVFSGSRSCLEELIPRVDKLLGGAGVGLKDVDRFAVDVGPGGMTGLKIGIVTVKTLAQAVGAPVVPVSALHALCHGARGMGGALFPVVKCMKHEFFNAVYRASGGGVECVAEERLVNENMLLEGFRKVMGGGPLVLGDAADRARELFAGEPGGAARFAEGDANYPAAVSVCEIAAGAAAVDFREIVPRYLCLTSAERNFGIEA